MEDIFGRKWHLCPGCREVVLPDWDPVCGLCAERNWREENDAWLEQQAIEAERGERITAGHPGRPDFGARALRRALRGDRHEKT